MLLQEIQALVAALQAQDWSGAFVLAVAIAREVYLDLTRQGLQPHVVRMQAPASPITVEQCTDALDAECQATKINPGNLLAILAALLKLLLPLVVK